MNDAMKLRIVPTNLKTANEFVRKLHRHNRPGRTVQPWGITSWAESGDGLGKA